MGHMIMISALSCMRYETILFTREMIRVYLIYIILTVPWVYIFGDGEGGNMICFIFIHSVFIEEY